MTDLSTFKPSSVGELFDAIFGVIAAEGKKWWEKTRKAIEVHVKSLSDAIMHTKNLVVAGDMSTEEAQFFFDQAAQSFETVVPFTKYMSIAAAHRIIKQSLSIVGWAVFNLTGMNFFPKYVAA